MTAMTTKILALGLSAALLMNIASAAPTENIYRIEMVLFERTAKPNEADGEHWYKNIELKYPDVWRRLISPEEEAARLAELAAQDKSSQFALSDDFMRSIAVDKATPQTTTQTNTADLVDTDESQTGGIRFYEFLPESEKSLQAAQKALNRHGNLRTLFHQTWLQALESGDNAPALILRAGNQYGSHFELEGSITLSVSRYLHIQTNLWFTQFVPNYGQPSDHWPALPTFPLFDHTDSVEQQVNTDNNASDSAWPKIDLSRLETPPANGTAALSNLPMNTAGNNSDYDEYSTLLEEPYLIKEIITMQQKRKMRSGELHYIDHPRLGLLIKIVPYKDVTN